MKKLFFVFISLCFCALSASAQSTKTLSGTIIDKYGNPVPGALIIATGGADNTTTDVDGSFTYEVPFYLESVTVKSSGMFNKRVNIKKNRAFKDGQLVIKMKQKDKLWFAEGQIGVGVTKYQGGQIGAMGGFLGNNWGGYLKFTAGDGFVLAAGATKNLWKDLHLHFGTGVTHFSGYENHDPWSTTGQAFDFGVIQVFNNGITASLSVTPVTDYGKVACTIYVGVGYAF